MGKEYFLWLHSTQGCTDSVGCGECLIPLPDATPDNVREMAEKALEGEEAFPLKQAKVLSLEMDLLQED